MRDDHLIPALTELKAKKESTDVHTNHRVFRARVETWMEMSTEPQFFDADLALKEAEDSDR